MDKILVIEDEQAVRDVIVDMLDAENFYPVSAQNGQIGVKLAHKHLPDLIICDVMMPEMDGYEVLTHLRQSPETATIPFMFLTAKADKTDVRQGMELGADDYLTKPFTRHELLQAIAARLQRKSAVERKSQESLEELRNNISMSLPQELHTPLHTIIQSAEELINDFNSIEPAEILDLSESIHSSATYLYRLIQNFLLMAELSVISTDLEQIKALRSRRINYSRAVVAQVAEKVAQSYNRSTDLKLELSESTAQISELKLKKIAEELIDNAFKFSPAGTPVRIITFQHEGTFTLYIADQGLGMKTDQISKIGAYLQFAREVYQQGGAGLGLAIAKRLTELHDGELLIESIAHKQTVVRVSLPA